VNIDAFAARFQAIRAEVARVLVGQEEVIDQTLVAVLAGGHVLIEGAPGLGKTLLVRALGQVIGCGFKRIQFTPDLMPSDVTGGNVFNQRKDEFDFFPGPVFTQLLLADEINRAPAKTQSALLEAMQERSVTCDGVTRRLPHPFFVIATQNPIESQGTYPLPEAQLDRFLFKLNILHPTRAAEKSMLVHYLQGFDATALESFAVKQVVTADELVAMQGALPSVMVASEVLDYITDIVGRTRTHRSIQLGASPRASIALLQAARVVAASQGRDFVVPDDVKALATSVMRHRVMLHPDAEIEGVSPDECIAGILREATVPKTAAA
jgi:MoxR-like ATPase